MHTEVIFTKLKSLEGVLAVAVGTVVHPQPAALSGSPLEHVTAQTLALAGVALGDTMRAAPGRKTEDPISFDDPMRLDIKAMDMRCHVSVFPDGVTVAVVIISGHTVSKSLLRAVDRAVRKARLPVAA